MGSTFAGAPQVTRSKAQVARAAQVVAAGLVEPGTPATIKPLVGLQEIARMFGVKPNTVAHWRSTQGILPAEDDTISGNPVWKIPTMYRFAASSGKPIVWDPWQAAFETAAGEV
jgi:hypothetical protein